MNNKLIELRSIDKSFDGERVLCGIDLDIHDKEFVTLLGPSGCGKTTTLRIIGGFETPDTGDVIFDGERINDLPPYKRQVNTVFQKYALFPHLNVYDNVAFGLRLQKVNEDEIRDRVREMLTMTGLKGFEARKPGTLSGGQQQRLCIARALAMKPDVLLMDEPTSALDPIATKHIEELLLELQKEVTILIVTHNMGQAKRISSKSMFMYLGELVEYGDTETMFTNPSDERTKAYLTGKMG